MRKLITILSICIAVFSCSKDEVNVTPIDFCSIAPLNRPALSITATVLNPLEVQVMWQRKGKDKYTVQRKEDNPISQWQNRKVNCQCHYYRDTLPVAGSYLYRVISGSTISNVVSITTVAVTPPPPRTIKIVFDPYYVEYWNAFLQDTTLLGSGLDQPSKDSVLKYARIYFAIVGLTVVTEGPAMQTIVLTQSSTWYGNYGEVAVQGSYGQPNQEIFVFTNNLQYNWKYVVKGIMHGGGHSLDLWHLMFVDWDNWMSQVFGILPQFFYTVVDVWGNTVDQIEVIRQKIL